MILWTVDDEIPKFLAMVRWGTLFLNCSTIFSRSCPQSGEPRAIFACECLSNSFIPTHGTHLFPISLLTCGNFQTGVWWAFLNFLRLFGHLSQLLWNVLQPSNSKLMIIFPKKKKLISLNIEYLVFVVYSIEFRLNIIWKSLYSVFIYV